MRKILLSFIFSIFITLAWAQPYGNEWINFSTHSAFSDQQYFKIAITREGIYRISADSLIKSGIPVKTSASPSNPVDTRNLQIFLNGKEQHIFVGNSNNGVFASNGFLEFYGKGNDGSTDTALYITKNAQPNPRYSLFNDTAYYFVTWNNSINNLRIQAQSDQAFSGYTSVPFIYTEYFKQYINSYYDGEHDDVGSSDPEYISGEGWAGGIFQFSTVSDQINLPNLSTYAGSIASFNSTVLGVSNDHNFNGDHLMRILVGSVIYKDTTYEGYRMNRFSFNVNPSVLNSGINTVQFTSDYYGGSNKPAADAQAVAWYSMRYPHTPVFTGESTNTYSFQLDTNKTGQLKYYLSFTDFADGGEAPVLYDLSGNNRILVNKTGNTIQALIPGIGRKNCFLSSESAVNNISATNIKPVNSDPTRFAKFRNLENENKEFLIISHKALWSSALKYQTYRQQTGKSVVLVDIQELYDQFGYGINFHPLSIRRFLDYAMDKWDITKPEYMLLLGKSISPEGSRNNKTYNFVPTVGFPASDNALAIRINGNNLKPAVQVGRISAINTLEIDAYLSKLAEYESNTVDEWMKHAIHLGGGNDITQQTQFGVILNDYESIIKDTLTGFSVSTFLKDATGIAVNLGDSIKNLVENGVSLVTFFGHSSPNLFDNSLDAPDNYNIKKGHYSFFIANGCYAGNVHTFDFGHPDVRSSSEQYILNKTKGSIGFWASSYLATVGPLQTITAEFYRNYAYKYYGQPIGKIIQQAINIVQPSLPANMQTIYLKEVCLNMTLEGDPSVIVNAPEKPDYKVTSKEISFNPGTVSTDMTNFDMTVVVTNQGKATRDSIWVNVHRKYGDNTDTTYRFHFRPVYFKDTLKLTLPVDEIKGPGLNVFDVFVDATNLVSETSTRNPAGELNNRDTVKLLIQSSDLIPVYPSKYAIYGSNKVTLKAVTGNLFAPVKNYQIEIDTTDQFNSPFKQTKTFTQKGGVITWDPNLTLTDSTVYFWRTQSDNGKWVESSFIYLPGQRGWSQKHFFQFKNDVYNNLKSNRAKRKLEFVNEVRNLTINTYARSAGNYSEYEIGYSINNLPMRHGSCAGQPWGGFTVAIFDPIHGDVWMSKRRSNGKGQYGDYHCTTYDLPSFDYRMGYPTERDSMRILLDQIVPNGYYVIIYSAGSCQYSAMDTSLKGAIRRLGSNKIDTLRNGAGFALVTRKGFPLNAHEKSSNDSNVFMRDSLVLKWINGSITSEKIGPSRNWKTLKMKSHPLEPVASKDYAIFDVIGVDKNGKDSVLIKSLTKDSINVSLTRINGRKFQYLKLRGYLTDSVLRTPTQIDYWQVYYDGLPEATLNPAKYYSFHSDTLQEGDVMSFSTAIENISDYSMDSLRLKFWFYDKNKTQHVLYNRNRKPLKMSGSGQDTLLASVSINTKGYYGNNSLWIEFNPDTLQPEQFHFNDISNSNFYVKKDNMNPLVDVTFDGVHILDGDIVSSKPMISIKLRDENKYLVLNDTASFKVWLLPPGDTRMDNNRLYFNNAKNNAMLRFKPGTSATNVAELEYNPVLLKDGIYSLLVEGKDISNNQPKKTYKVSFEVINKSSITEILNYPNPFSTSTKFVFTLTGSELPTDMKIQIMTVTGKVVREILMSELGPIRIGRNITDFAWDGKDQFGDQLANGVYIYRVVTHINGDQIEKRSTEADKFFVKGYGKMYLLK